MCYFGSVFYWLPSQSCICITQSDYQFCSNSLRLLFFINQPPTVLRSNDAQTEQETVEISVTRLLLKSYYEIVSKNIQDSVPKAIMHFLVSQCTWTTGWYGYRCLSVDATYMQCLQENSLFVFGSHLIVAQGFDLEKCIYISWSRWTIQSGSFKVSSSGSCTGIQLWLILSCVCYVHLCCTCCTGEFGWGWRAPCIFFCSV